MREGDGAAAKGRFERLEAELDRLAGLAVAGDRVATEQLLTLVRPTVVQYCRAQLNDGVGPYSPEDVAQDVLLAIFSALTRYRAGERAFMAFVYSVARNKVVDAFRKAGRDRSEPTDRLPDAVDTGDGPEAAAVLAGEVAGMHALLDQLSDNHREIIVLRVALRFSAEETARLVGSTPVAVRVAQHRAMTRLRALALAMADTE